MRRERGFKIARCRATSGATPFQHKPKEYIVKAPTIGMFGEISKDGESLLELIAESVLTSIAFFFASMPQVAVG